MARSSARQRRLAKMGGDLDITPMIDVTFLLLIFFMVTSTMQSTPDVELPVAYHGEGVGQNQQVIVSIVDEDGRPKLIFGDPPGEEWTLSEIVTAAREQLQTGKTGILVKASGRIPTGYVKEVTSELQRLGELQFYYGVSERNQ